MISDLHFGLFQNLVNFALNFALDVSDHLDDLALRDDFAHDRRLAFVAFGLQGRFLGKLNNQTRHFIAVMAQWKSVGFTSMQRLQLHLGLPLSVIHQFKVLLEFLSQKLLTV